MHFKHAYEFEYGAEDYDGGVVEYSTDGGFNWNDAGPLFIDNGYNGTLSSAWQNPLGGRQAFVNLSNGYISSRLDLSSLAGQDVRFRFRIGTDESGDYTGWFIDDIRIYTCENATPPPSLPQDLGKTDGSPDSPCFIATAAYGSPYGNYIDLLRAFRDEYLMTHPIGKKWVALYYRYSPPMAGFIADHPKMRKGVRLIILPFVALSAGMVQTTPIQKGLIFCFIVGLLLGMALLYRGRKAEKWVSLIDPS